MKRFWDKVEKSDEADGCWEWTGSKVYGGYGKIWFNGKYVRAHRMSWILMRGGIPDGLWVLHRCDNPGCVNPNHLFLGTRSDNMKDCAKKGRLRIWNLKMTAKEIVEIRERYFNGDISQKELAEEYSLSRKHISKIVRKDRWKDIDGPTSTDNLGRKLSEQDVMEIRRLHKEGMVYKELGDRYGVTKGTIGCIVRRETWSHID